MSTTETKCPTCGGPALDRSGFWETCWTPVPVSADASARIAHERDNRLSARCHQLGAELNVLAAQTEELRAENAALRAEILRLRWRLSDAEIIGAAAVRFNPAATVPLPWGRDDLMAIAAVRYCLGRTSYIVGDCADWLHAQWPHISAHARSIISRDIEEAFVRDDAARATGAEYHPLGMDIDRRVWEGVRRMWQDENKTEGV